MRPLYRNLLILLALANLIFWIFFAGKLALRQTEAPPDISAPAEPESSVIFSVPEEPVIYDGSGLLQVMDGVSAFSENGEDLTERITVSVESAAAAEKPLEERTLTYSLKAGHGKVLTRERRLLLSNYTGPSILFTGAGTSMDAADLPKAAESLHGAGLLSADDGFGHDISASLHMSSDTAVTISGSYTFTITTENLLGDTAKLRTSLYIHAGESHVTLSISAKTLTLPVGSTFDPMDYLAAAWDSADGDLTPYVRIRNTVDPDTPGIYTVTYTVANLSGISADPQVLTVSVVP